MLEQRFKNLVSERVDDNLYAKRRLKEEQMPSRTISYDRRYVPDIFPGDLIRLNYPEEKISGTFEIRSQNITLGFAGKTSEEVIEV